jgi:hypothetical protein
LNDDLTIPLDEELIKSQVKQDYLKLPSMVESSNSESVHTVKRKGTLNN